MSSDTRPRRGALEALALVGRAPHAADLQPREHQIRIVRIKGDLRHARPHHRRAGLGQRRLHALPVLRAVGRAEDAGRTRAGQNQVRIVRRAHHRPDAQLIHHGRQMGPFAPRDIEPVDAGIGAGQQLARPVRCAESAHTRVSLYMPDVPQKRSRFRRGRRCTRRRVPPCRYRGVAPHASPFAVFLCSIFRHGRRPAPQ